MDAIQPHRLRKRYVRQMEPAAGNTDAIQPHRLRKRYVRQMESAAGKPKRFSPMGWGNQD